MRKRVVWKVGSCICVASMIVNLCGCQFNLFEEKKGAVSPSDTQEVSTELFLESSDRITSLKAEHTALDVFIGETETIQPVVAGSEVYRLHYYSTDEAVCTVSPSGTVTGVAEGKATVVLEDTFSGLKSYVLVLVKKKVLPERIVLVEEEIKVGLEESIRVDAKVEPADTTDKTLIWTSSDEAIATVTEKGEITGVAKGTCTITVISQMDETIMAELAVEVVKEKQYTDQNNGTSNRNNGSGSTNNSSGNSNAGSSSSGGSSSGGTGSSSSGGTGSSSGGSSSGGTGSSSGGSSSGGTGSGSGGSNSGGTGSSSGGSSTEATEVSAYYMDSYAEQVLTIVNARRAEEGLAPLTMNYTLVSAAKVRAEEITRSFSHTRPDGSSCFTAFDQAGVSYWGAGENIAAGQGSPESVMNSWMNSSGHRANIMNPDYTQIGIACYYDPNSPYRYNWVQCFIY